MITVSTNDPKHPKESLSCKGHILEPMVIEPKRIKFLRVAVSAGLQTRKITLTRGDGGPISPVVDPPTDKSLEVQLHEIEPGERYELEVVMNPALVENWVRTDLKINTGVKEAPVVSINVAGSVQPRVAALPRQIIVPATPAGDWSQTVALQWDHKEAHKIVSATSDVTGLRVEVTGSDQDQHVLVRVSEDFHPKPGRHEIRIVTDDTKSPVVKVPVYVSRRPASAARKAAVGPRTMPHGSGSSARNLKAAARAKANAKAKAKEKEKEKRPGK